VIQAVEMGGEYLRRQQSSSGAWQSFRGADQWVTGFVLATMTGVPVLSETTRCRGRQWLIGSSPGAVWGYSGRHPPDCDSTAWAILALKPPDHVFPGMVEKAFQFLSRHRHTSGGFATYNEDTPGASTYDRRRRSAWFEPQVCVTAVAALAAQSCGMHSWVDSALSYLLASRLRNGCWGCYWWHGIVYSTYHVGLLLSRAGRRSELLVRPGVLDRWRDRLSTKAKHQRSNAACSDFYQGYALLIDILMCRPRRLIELAADALRSQQNKDGSFPGGAILRVPLAIGNRTALSVDKRGILSTTVCTRALWEAHLYLTAHAVSD
jgi:hypothetical protein